MTYKEYDNVELDKSEIPCPYNFSAQHAQTAYKQYWMQFYTTFPRFTDAPESVSSVRTLLSTPNIGGIISNGTYLFTRCYYLGDTRIIRINVDTDEILYTNIEEEIGSAFAVLDPSNILIVTRNMEEDFGLTWEIYNMEWGNRQFITFHSDLTYVWHWAVVNNVLTIANWSEIWDWEADVIIHRHYDNWMYNIKTGEELYSEFGEIEHADAFQQYPECPDVIVGSKFFYSYHSDYFDGDFPGADSETANLFVSDTETNTITRIRPLYNLGDGGNCRIYQLTYNPIDGMIYFIAEHLWGSVPANYSYGVAQMNPDNYDYNYIYEADGIGGAPQDDYPMSLISGESGTYILKYDGSISNVLDANTTLASIPTSVSHNWLNKIQGEDLGYAVDGQNCVWYVEPPNIKAVSLITGEITVDFNAGIAELIGTYPIYPYRQVYLGGDRVFVVNVNASGNSIIYEIK